MVLSRFSAMPRCRLMPLFCSVQPRATQLQQSAGTSRSSHSWFSPPAGLNNTAAIKAPSGHSRSGPLTSRAEFIASSLMPHLAAKETNGQPQLVLDAGCGTGLVGESLLTAASDMVVSVEVDGCDVSPNMVNLARWRGYSACEIADLNNMPMIYSSHKYDAAMYVGPFVQGHDDHVAPAPLLPELCRVVKPGGVILATVPSTPFTGWVLKRLQRQGHRVRVRTGEFQNLLETPTAMLVQIEVAGRML